MNDHSEQGRQGRQRAITYVVRPVAATPNVNVPRLDKIWMIQSRRSDQVKRTLNRFLLKIAHPPNLVGDHKAFHQLGVLSSDSRRARIASTGQGLNASKTEHERPEHDNINIKTMLKKESAMTATVIGYKPCCITQVRSQGEVSDD